MIAATLALAMLSSARAENAARVFAVGDKAAAVYDRRIEFYTVPPQTIVTVGGLSAYGPLPASGELSFHPEVRPSSELRLVQPISQPLHPERNAARFLACTGRIGMWETKRSSDNMCGVVDVSGKIVYEPPDTDAEGTIDALALSSDGREAIFEYRHGKTVDSYLIWTQSRKKPKTYKADMRDLELRRTLNRFGLNDWNPEPQEERKPGDNP